MALPRLALHVHMYVYTQEVSSSTATQLVGSFTPGEHTTKPNSQCKKNKCIIYHLDSYGTPVLQMNSSS